MESGFDQSRGMKAIHNVYLNTMYKMAQQILKLLRLN